MTQGQFNWLVTGPTATAALLRVSWIDGAASDVSDVPFAIQDPRITITNPNGGQRWVIGTSRNVTWTHNLGTGESVAVELSRDGGAIIPTFRPGEFVGAMTRVRNPDGSPVDVTDVRQATWGELEGRRLAAEAYRVALAEGLLHGIRRFLEEGRRSRTL